SYYLIETDLVPLLQPFQLLIPKPILTALDVPLRVVIEDAYDRDVGPGVPAPADWRPIKDLAGMAIKLLASVPVAVDNFVEDLGLS
ncbi:PE-PPE domain-containing protein, partial [Mycobacterium sp. ITM-2017-0098]